MKVIQCKNHHYYDSEKYNMCPYCQDNASVSSLDYKEEEEKTVSQFSEASGEERTEAFFQNTGLEEKTIGMFRKPGETNLVTGWLVCISGMQKGASYELGYGRNFIGRSLNSDISFSDDMSVSRENHASIVFEDKSCCFYVVPGAGAVKLENQVITAPQMLEEDKLLEIGESRYRFIPYCKERRTWE